MKTYKSKRLFVLVLIIASVFLFVTGCTININIGSSSENTANEADSKNLFDSIFNNENLKSTMYKSCATIYISTKGTTESAISSSDLVVSKSLADTCETILQSDSFQNEIREEYPNVKYELTLESINETEVFTIVAVGPNPEDLEEICNMAVSLLCEKISRVVEGVSCKVIDYATAAQLVG